MDIEPNHVLIVKVVRSEEKLCVLGQAKRNILTLYHHVKEDNRDPKYSLKNKYWTVENDKSG